MSAIPSITTGDITAKVGASNKYGDLLTNSGAKITAPVFNFGTRAADLLSPSGGGMWVWAAVIAVVVGAIAYFRRKG